MSEAREARFARLVREHGAGIARLAAVYAAAPADRDDLVQDILLALWLALPRFRGACSERTFVYRIAHNHGISTWRRRRPPAAPLETAHEIQDPRPDPADQAATALARDRLAAAVRSLPPSLRSVVALHLEGLDSAAIAEVLGLSGSNVAVRLSRARQRLRELLTTEAPVR